MFSHASPTEPIPPFSNCAGAALLQIEGETLWICDVHLITRDWEMRAREAAVLQQKVMELTRETDNIIVLGDFNLEADETPHSALKEMDFSNAMEDRGGGIQATMDSFGINASYVDHVYVSAPLRNRLTSAHVVRQASFRHDGPQAPGLWVQSDHLPVVAEFDWP